MEPEPRAQHVARPATLREFLANELHNGRYDVTLWRRLLPIRMALLYLIILALFSAGCFGIGALLDVWTPHSQLFAPTDWPTKFVNGVLLLLAFFVASTLITGVRVFVSVHLVGVGSNIVIN